MARRDDVPRLYKPVLTGRLSTRKNTQKSKFLLSQAFKWEKNYVVRNPRDAIYTFVMLYKKLPDHFKSTLNVNWPTFT